VHNNSVAVAKDAVNVIT